ncbi:hypothetical protein [Bartonella vinsonii]|uniref:hypothetical protein n=1 Tax=Bartonella vinsonii TaxID=33047 RepID=UPI0003486EDA|nr:hypothetical protein [Bartonella vinsonii]
MNPDTVTNTERKAKTSLLPHALIENNLPLNSLHTERTHSGNEFLPIHTVSQHTKTKDDTQSHLSVKHVENTTFSTPKTTPNTSSEAHVNLSPKIEATSQAADDTKKPSKLADNNKTVVFSHTWLNSEKKPKRSRHKWQALW